MIWLGNFWYYGIVVAEESCWLTRGGHSQRLGCITSLMLLNHSYLIFISVSTVGSTTKHVYWDINKRAAVGENILHLCFLNATRVHYEIAKIIIKKYPPLVNDIYISDEFYGKQRSMILTLIWESIIYFTFSAHFCLQHFSWHFFYVF